MKRLLFCISLLIYIQANLFGQAISGFNITYGIPSIRTITPLSESAYNPNLLITGGFSIDSIIDEIQYFDGLGRPVQIVQRAMSPDSYLPFEGAEARDYKDLIIHQEYDTYGRQSTSWLPTVSSYAGAFISLDIIKENAKNLYKDSAYSHPVYEASPLNRIIEQYSPGKKWYDNTRPVKTEYLTNKGTSGELSCMLFTVEGSGLSTTLKSSGYYNNADLFVTRMTNEDQSISYEFKDKLGQVLLTRQVNESSQLLDTYYVYDDFSNLCFVLPPILSEIASKGTPSVDNLGLYGYQYKYDDRKRCIQKHLPGAGHINYIYDKADRLIFTQDAEQRIKGEWLFTLSDALGRKVLTGICKNTDITNEKYENLLLEAESKDDGTYRGYNLLVNGEKTNLTSVKLLTVNYYDNYNFLGKYTPNWQFTPKDGYGIRFTGDNKGYETKGLLTGTSVALLDGSDTFLHSVSYYDNRGRVVQAISSNHLEGEDKTRFAYNYTNQINNQQHEHTAKGKDTQTELYSYIYDRAGRLIRTDYKLNELPVIILAENKYNRLGQLESNTPANIPGLKTSYAYNIRSWTESISNPLFNQTLDYTYSGNIEKMTWKQNADTKEREYSFVYDPLSRLKEANYKGMATEDYSTTYSYDAHGNIQFLKRNGLTDDQKPGLIDDLEFKYIGNQIKSVHDHADAVRASASMDVKNYTNQDIEFLYNANGAMTQDLNKGIQDISYNYLNLPKELFIDNDNIKAKNTYTYTADGSKLKVVYKSDPKQKEVPVSGIAEANDLYSQIQTTDYVDNMIYEEGSLKRILLSNGYYDNDDKKFYFYIKDHLGNNRVVADASGTVTQSNHYYPFGMTFAESTTAEQSSQPYKYNGKELDETHGLNWYDYSARFYDTGYITLPTMDPLADTNYSISPYAYCGNNPIKRTDPIGEDWYGDNDGNYIWTSSSDDTYIDKEGKEWNNKGTSLKVGNIIFKQKTGSNGQLTLYSEVFDSEKYEKDKDAIRSWQNSDASRSAQQKYWDNPTMRNWVKYLLTEVVSQYTNPYLLAAGATAIVGGISNRPLKGGALRAATHGESWVNGSLSEAINKFAPGARGIPGGNGKIIYRNSVSGVQVVHDTNGNYFRIQNTTLTGKRQYLNMEGDVPNNKMYEGRQIGRSQSEYNQVTHFSNTDN